MTASPTANNAAIALHTLLDLDADADAVLRYVLTGEPVSTEPMGPLFTDLVALLDPAHVPPLLRRLDLCPVHRCDAQICADDENPECVEERTDDDEDDGE